ncbi:MAG TPA: LytTR family DNA-binding domain-containing protein [Chitinophagaceae bacterium]|nr:response regulator transcription factor [Chitinophagaceae bacterium]MCB9055018.1 response regulator transcription factor [Chitinophagales bacterium]HPG12375.1 LytTR family DNA-binding domain-containing protein [Chitinophagaceae bacterium]HRX92818.1 LytTR family DNA-binding domain-containing protein [Chitinophagaceae bacterium]
MIKAVIIDDEQHSIDTLKWKLENYCPEVEVVAAFDNPANGIAYLQKTPPGLLFLDIEMPMLNGFDVLEELGRDLPFDIIFTTAYDNFGIQAVKFSALDYLLKPVQNKELKEAIEKHIKKTQQKIPAEQLDVLLNNVHAERKGKVGKIALASKESIEFVEAQDIICCEANSNYTNVFMDEDRKRVISRTLKEFEDMLLPHNFFRPHNSFLINLKRVKEFIRGDGGYLVMENKMKIPVSKGRKEELMDLLA